jgi:hypothetical protein
VGLGATSFMNKFFRLPPPLRIKKAGYNELAYFHQ